MLPRKDTQTVRIKNIGNLGPIALFSENKLATSIEKTHQKVNHPHKTCLLFKYITWSRCGDDLSIGFNHHRERPKNEIAKIRTVKREDSFENMFRDVFGRMAAKSYIFIRI